MGFLASASNSDVDLGRGSRRVFCTFERARVVKREDAVVINVKSWGEQLCILMKLAEFSLQRKWMLQYGNNNVWTGCFVWMDIRDYITDDSRISPGLG